jgi:hypothetical protein
VLTPGGASPTPTRPIASGVRAGKRLTNQAKNKNGEHLVLAAEKFRSEQNKRRRVAPLFTRIFLSSPGR